MQDRIYKLNILIMIGRIIATIILFGSSAYLYYLGINGAGWLLFCGILTCPGSVNINIDYDKEKIKEKIKGKLNDKQKI